jgi:hypothetical protein
LNRLARLNRDHHDTICRQDYVRYILVERLYHCPDQHGIDPVYNKPHPTDLFGEANTVMQQAHFQFTILKGDANYAGER